MTADTWIRVCAVSLCLMLFGLSYYRIRQGKRRPR